MAVALAAVVGVVPAFAQPSCAEAALSSSVVLPVGDELEDTTLADVDGEAWPAVVPLVKLAAKWLGTALIAAERVTSSGCQKAVQVTGQAAAKIGDLTMQGVTVATVKATEHPLARDTFLSAGAGIGGSALSAGFKNEPFTLKDAAFGALVGGGLGALTHGAGRGIEELAKRLTGR